MAPGLLPLLVERRMVKLLLDRPRNLGFYRGTHTPFPYLWCPGMRLAGKHGQKLLPGSSQAVARRKTEKAAADSGEDSEVDVDQAKVPIVFSRSSACP